MNRPNGDYDRPTDRLAGKVETAMDAGVGCFWLFMLLAAAGAVVGYWDDVKDIAVFTALWLGIGYPAALGFRWVLDHWKDF